MKPVEKIITDMNKMVPWSQKERQKVLRALYFIYERCGNIHRKVAFMCLSNAFSVCYKKQKEESFKSILKVAGMCNATTHNQFCCKQASEGNRFQGWCTCSTQTRGRMCCLPLDVSYTGMFLF